MGIYSITNEIEEFMAYAEAEDIPMEAVLDTLEALQMEFDEKADNIACAIKNTLAEVDALKKEEQALQARRASKERLVERMKYAISAAMQRLGKSKIESSRNLITFRKSQSLVIQNENEFKTQYPDYCTTETVIKIPKKEITELIKKGKTFSGVSIETKQNIQIK